MYFATNSYANLLLFPYLYVSFIGYMVPIKPPTNFFSKSINPSCSNLTFQDNTSLLTPSTSFASTSNNCHTWLMCLLLQLLLVNIQREIAYFGHFKVVPKVLFGVIIELAIDELKK